MKPIKEFVSGFKESYRIILPSIKSIGSFLGFCLTIIQITLILSLVALTIQVTVNKLDLLSCVNIKISNQIKQ